MPIVAKDFVSTTADVNFFMNNLKKYAFVVAIIVIGGVLTWKYLDSLFFYNELILLSKSDIDRIEICHSSKIIRGCFSSNSIKEIKELFSTSVIVFSGPGHIKKIQGSAINIYVADSKYCYSVSSYKNIEGNVFLSRLDCKTSKIYANRVSIQGLGNYVFRN